MPLALLILAALFILTGIKGNYQAVGAQFNQTFGIGTGSNGFFSWFASMMGIAIIFRVIQAPRAGEAFIALLMIVYVLENQNALTALDTAIQGAGTASGTSSGTSAPTVQPGTTAPAAPGLANQAGGSAVAPNGSSVTSIPGS